MSFALKTLFFGDRPDGERARPSAVAPVPVARIEPERTSVVEAAAADRRRPVVTLAANPVQTATAVDTKAQSGEEQSVASNTQIPCRSFVGAIPSTHTTIVAIPEVIIQVVRGHTEACGAGVVNCLLSCCRDVA